MLDFTDNTRRAFVFQPYSRYVQCQKFHIAFRVYARRINYKLKKCHFCFPFYRLKKKGRKDRKIGITCGRYNIEQKNVEPQ